MHWQARGPRRLPGAIIAWWIASSPCRSAAPDAQGAAVCPEGYFRRAVITFSCNASSGAAHVALAPGEAREVVYLGPGVRDLVLNATSDLDVDVELIPVTNGTEPSQLHPRASTAGSDDEDGNGSSRILQSGDPPRAATERHIEIMGTSSSAYILSLRNSDSGWATVTLQYEHSGTLTCREVPVPIGCDSFEAITAEEVADSWGRLMRMWYPNADAAWLTFSATQWELSSSGIPWFRWQAAWPADAGSPGRPQATSAGMAFHFLDTDRNGLISQSEFNRGYDGDVHWSISSPAQPVALTPVGLDAPTSTSEAGSVRGWAPLGMAGPLGDIQQGKTEVQSLISVFVAALFVLMLGSIWLVYVMPAGSARKTRSAHISASDCSSGRATSGGAAGAAWPQLELQAGPRRDGALASPRAWRPPPRGEPPSPRPLRPAAPPQAAATPQPMSPPPAGGGERRLALAGLRAGLGAAAGQLRQARAAGLQPSPSLSPPYRYAPLASHDGRPH